MGRYVYFKYFCNIVMFFFFFERYNVLDYFFTFAIIS